MPPRTRRQGPLPAFDLDPWHSNSDRFPVAPPPVQSRARRVANPALAAPPPLVRRVARNPSLSTLSSLSTLPEEREDPANAMTHRQNRARSVPLPNEMTQPTAHITPIEDAPADQPLQAIGQPPQHPNQPSHDNVPAPPQQSPTPDVDTDALFQRFNRELSLVPASRSALTATSKIKQPWEFRVKEFAEANHLKWDGSNYVSWKKVQMVVFRTYKWIGHAEGTNPPPENVLSPEYDLWQTVDHLTISQICMNMDFDLYGEIAEGLETAAELWRAIERRFSQKTAAARSTAKLNLDNKKILPGEAMKEHITSLRKLKTQYLNCGGKMDDADWHTIVLNSLSDHEQWKTLTVFGHSHPHSDSLIAFLEDQDARGFAKSPKPETALQSRPVSRFRPRIRNNYVCTHCSKLGHTVQDCWAPGGGAADKRPANYRVPQHMLNKEHAQLTAQIAALERQRAQLATVTESYRESAQTADTIQHRIGDAAMIAGEVGASRDAWVYDTGASTHMTNDLANFSTYEEIHPTVVATADDRDNAPLLAVARGTVLGRFYYNGETTIVPLKDVLYVPNLSQNLVSYIQIDRKGIQTCSNGGTIEFFMRGVAYAKAVIKNKQVIMDMDVEKEKAHLTVSNADVRQPLHVWHQRLAHLNQHRVEQLARDNLVRGMDISSSNHDRCEACVLGKMTATPAPPRELRAKQPGDIIHCDIEYMLAKSFSAAIYSLKFLDEYSNYLWCHALTNKTAEVILLHWKNLVKALKVQHNIVVKALHTDNGTEFVNSTMDEFNQTNGIAHHLTVPF